MTKQVRRDVAKQIGGLIWAVAKGPAEGQLGTDPDGPGKAPQPAN